MNLRKGDRGDAVGKLQQALVEAGYTMAADELSQSMFGASTLQAVRGFQAAHVDDQGHALTEDGVVGPATLWAIEHPGGGGALQRSRLFGAAEGWRADPSAARSPLLTAMLVDAIADIGKREDPDGSNDGPELAKFNTKARPWCALAVSTWMNDAGVGARVRLGGQPGTARIAGVYTLYDWARKEGRIRAGGELPEVGDAFIILRGGGHGHTGLVAAVLAREALGDARAAAVSLRICTVEGNAGNAVRGLVRPVASITHFVRLE